MPSIHGSPYWSSAKHQATSYYHGNGPISYQGWKIQKEKESTTLTYLFSSLCSPTLQECFKMATLQILKGMNQDPYFSVNPHPSLQSAIKKYSKIFHLLGNNGCFEKAKHLAIEYFNERRGLGSYVIIDDQQHVHSHNRFIFSSSLSQTQLKHWLKEMHKDCVQYIHTKFDTLTNKGPYFYSSDDLAFLKKKENYLPSSQSISCFNYVFLKKQIEQAKELICFHGQLEKDTMLLTLQSWGFRVITHPNEGDIVLYFNENEKVPEHAGIYLENGQVEGKWGLENPNIYHHELFDVPPNYGKLIVFMRKSAATLF